MSTKVYMVVLQGGGDTQVSYINKETWDWINNEAVKAPQVQVEKVFSDTHCTYETTEEVERDLNQWRGSSPDNDRALSARPDHGEMFFDVKSAMKYARDNDLEVTDSFEGYIY